MLRAAVLGAAVAGVAYSRRTLTLYGAVAASFVGAIVFFKGGGAAVQGVSASLIGATVVGLGWTVFGGGRGGVLIAAIAGTSGSLLDSLVGATVQALYKCPACGQFTESRRHGVCGQNAQLVRGQ